MPELPEVETIRNGLKRTIVGKKIQEIEVRWKGSIKSGFVEFVKIMKGNKIERIDRVGKLLIFELKRDKKYILVHLKMTGQLVYIKKRKIIAGGHKMEGNDLDLPNRHTRIIINFSDGSQLFFSDLRKFGYWCVVNEKKKNEVVSKFGVEPIDRKFTLIHFKEILNKKKTSIKAILLNQKYIAGIGNIYADEICFRAKVLPNRLVYTLNDNEIQKIHNSCVYILKKAIKSGGTTFSNYLNHDGKKGNFSQYLKVYGRAKKKCFKCGGIIQKSKIASRSSHYCIKCQF